MVHNNNEQRLKTKKTEIKVSELFRQKLEGYEIVPDGSVKKKLMRKLELQEFMHFNLFRFNIWYLALITAGLITGLLLLISGEPQQEQVPEVAVKTGTEIIINKQPAILHPADSNNLRSLPASTETPVISMTPDNTIIENSADIKERTITQNTVSEAASKDGLIEYQKNGNNISEKVLSRERALFEASATNGCSPLKLKFHKIPALCDSCRWTFGDGGLSSESDPEWIFDTEGEYKVELTVFCPQKPPEKSFILINVYPRPLARFEITPENPAIPGEPVTFLNFSSGASVFKWNFGDGRESDTFEPIHSYGKPGKYNVSLIAISDNGCSDSVKIDNVLSGSEYYIRFPNAFIPNQLGPSGGYYSARTDESSVVFHPVFSGVTDYQLRIFSKMGIMIFESNDVNIGWDGYVDGVLSSAGVYIWKVRGKFRNGESFIRMGDVTLIKAVPN